MSRENLPALAGISLGAMLVAMAGVMRGLHLRLGLAQFALLVMAFLMLLGAIAMSVGLVVHTLTSDDQED